jgi:magnesium and cobalt transporter
VAEIDRFRFEVLRADSRRIHLLNIRLLPQQLDSAH